MTDTAKSIRLSLKQQLKESKMNFNLLPVPKKPELQQGQTKKTKLRLRKLPVPSAGQSLLPKCVFSRGPIAYGLVPRPKKPEGYDFDLKSSKQRSRRSMMTRDSSNVSGFTERVDSSRSLESISSRDESIENLSIRDLLEDSDDEPVINQGYINAEKPKQEVNETMSKNCPNVSSHRSVGGSTRRREQYRSSKTFQRSSSVKSFDCSISSQQGSDDESVINQGYFSVQKPKELNESMSKSCPNVSSRRSVGGRTGRREQHGSSKTFHSSSSVKSFDCSVSSLKGRDSFRCPSVQRVDRPKDKTRNGVRPSRTLQRFPTSKSMGNSVSSGRQESTADAYPQRQSIKRDSKDVEDELEITSHSVASQGRRKKRHAAADLPQQSTETSTSGGSARNKNKARNKVASACQSWVLWTNECSNTLKNYNM